MLVHHGVDAFLPRELAGLGGRRAVLLGVQAFGFEGRFEAFLPEVGHLLVGVVAVPGHQVLEAPHLQARPGL